MITGYYEIYGVKISWIDLSRLCIDNVVVFYVYWRSLTTYIHIYTDIYRYLQIYTDKATKEG